MKISGAKFLRVYAWMLQLYPPRFRAKHEAQLLDAARLQHGETENHGALACALLGDTMKASLRENLRDSGVASMASLLGFAAFFTLLLFVVMLCMQQVWRRGADKAPQQLVTEAKSTGVVPMDGEVREISSPAWVDGRDTFVATYDANGNVQASNGRFHGALPQPPRGIFQMMQKRSEHKVTWQPQRGVRVALVGQPLPQGGYVVAGQSLIPGEASTFSFYRLVLAMWGLMVLSLATIAVWTRRQRTA